MKRLVVLPVLALVLVFASAAHAGPRVKKYGIHTIHGKNYDRGAIEKLLDDSDGPAVVSADENVIGRLKGKFKLDKSKPVEEAAVAAVDFIDRHRNAFKLKEPKKELKLRSKDIHPNGNISISLKQTFNGIPIWGKSMGVHLTKQHDIYLIDGEYIPTPDIDTTPLITKDEALAISKQDLGIPPGASTWSPKVELILYPIPNFDPVLAYKVEIEEWLYFVNAKNGKIITRESTIRYE